MMKKKLIPAAGLLFTATSVVSAQLVYDPFFYGSNALSTSNNANGLPFNNLANQTGSVATPNFSGYTNPLNGQLWYDSDTNISATNEGKLLSGSLSPTIANGMPTSIGDSAWYGTSTRSPHLAITGQTGINSGTIYYSGLLTMTDLTNLAGAGGAFVASFSQSTGPSTGNPSGGNLGGRLQVRKGGASNTSTTTYQLGIKNAVAVSWTGTTQEFTTTDTVFVVVGYTFNPNSATDDVARLWINPSASDFGKGTPPAATLSVTEDLSSVSNNVEIGGMLIRGDNSLVAKTVAFDELRVDTSWAQVTPKAGTNWGGGTGNWSATLPDGALNFVNFNDGGGTVTVDGGGKTTGTIRIKSATPYNITGSTLTLDQDATNGGASAINVVGVQDSITGAISNGNHTISAPLVLSGATSANAGVSQNLTISGAISGAGSLRKAGAGSVVLTASNNYSGGTSVVGGDLIISDDSSLGAVPTSTTAGNITLTTGGVLKMGAANISLNANRGILIPSHASSSTVGAGTTLVNLFQGTVNTNGFNATINGVIDGGDLVKIGTGSLTLTASSTYGAAAASVGAVGHGTFVTGGTVIATSAGALGTETTGANSGNNVNLNGGTLKLGGVSTDFGWSNNRWFGIGPSGGTLDLNGHTFNQNLGGYGGNIQGIGGGTGGAFTVTGGGFIHYGGNNIASSLTVSGGSDFDVFNSGNVGFSGSGITLDNGTLSSVSPFTDSSHNFTINTGGGTINPNQFSVTWGGLIGSGALAKTGSGILAFGNGSPSYSGPITVSQGTLAAIQSNSFGDNSVTNTVTLGSGTVVAASNTTVSQNISLSGSDGTFSQLNSGDTATFSGAISGPGQFIKTNLAGTGVVKLTGTSNSWAGGTRINGGVLQAGNTNVFPTNTAMNVVAGGKTLDLNGFAQTIGSLQGGGTVLVSANLTTGGNNGTTTYSGPMSGVGTLIKEGTGMFNVNGVRLGGWTVNNGTVRVLGALGNAGHECSSDAADGCRHGPFRPERRQDDRPVRHQPLATGQRPVQRLSRVAAGPILPAATGTALAASPVSAPPLPAAVTTSTSRSVMSKTATCHCWVWPVLHQLRWPDGRQRLDAHPLHPRRGLQPRRCGQFR
jgi:fibronectin-binding autotransporter adhesin